MKGGERALCRQQGLGARAEQWSLKENSEKLLNESCPSCVLTESGILWSNSP